jgi:molecular chaperone DnaK
MSPEELSAEVLKSLRTDVRTSMGEDVRAAVITVPAAFEQPATNATQRAAKLAGIPLCPLLLEPVAASLAYGFQSEKDNVYWLVYDFGGGTFDAAVMRIRDGFIHVEGHDGDTHLGGKLLDWEIVTERLIPAAASQFDLPDLRRDNPRWRSAVGRLKLIAEQGKIEVCRTRAPVEISFDDWCEDATGRTIDFAYTLTPADVEAITRPYIERSLNLVRKTLREARLSGAAMERVLMVGGSTLNPWIREAVQAELGRPLEFGIDPVTVVARGAAIFASTIELRDEGGGDKAPTAPGTWLVQTEHKPVGNVQDPDIGGTVVPPDGKSPVGYTIEFSDVTTKWRSGRITLGSSGVFMTQLYAAKHGRHDYQIELCDPMGTPVPTDPEAAPYTFMPNVPTAPPAVQTIGVGLANGSVARYMTKGDRLPKRELLDHITTIPLRAGRRDDVLRIPLLEGEHARARRNHGIGVMEITGADIPRDLPEGSQIEVTVAMDESQQIRVHVFVEMFEKDFEAVFAPVSEGWSLDRLIREADEQKARLETGRTEARRGNAPGTVAILARIDDEDLLEIIRKQIAAAAGDPGALGMLDRRVRELAALIDDLEDALEWPKLVEQAQQCRKDAEHVVDQYGQADDKRLLPTLQVEFQKALDLLNADMLRRNKDDFDGLWWAVQDRRIEFHIARFEYRSTRYPEMTDQAQADLVIAQGQRAIKNGDIDALRAANRQLLALLPPGPEPIGHANEGTTLTRQRV